MPGPLDPRSATIAEAEGRVISTRPGFVPSHLDDGGHIPFGGTIGGTRGPSAFGKRKNTRQNTLGNPQALLLNYMPLPTPSQITNWERNQKSQVYEDPTADATRFVTSNSTAFGHAVGATLPRQLAAVPSHLASENRTYGEMSHEGTRPWPKPAFYPPERAAAAAGAAADVADQARGWAWPQRAKRAPMPRFERPERAVPKSFLEEYEIRPPWLKY